MTTAALGLTTGPLSDLGPLALARCGREAEDRGFSSVWVVEDRAGEAFSTLATVAAHTARIGLATGVVPLSLRTPPLLAMSVATLLAAAPGRSVVVGVGVSSPAVVGRWHGATYPAHPLAQVREFVQVLRACLSGERVRFSGTAYQVDGFRLGLPVDADRVRIVLAALGPGMLRLAGEVADGVLLNYLPPAAVPEAVEHVRAGGPARISAYVHCGLGDLDQELPALRRDVFSYVTADAYARVLSRAGFGTAVDAVRARHAAGDREGALAQIPRELVAQVKGVGDAAQVTARVAAFRAAGVDEPVVYPLLAGGDRDAAAVELLDLLAPAPLATSRDQA